MIIVHIAQPASTMWTKMARSINQNTVVSTVCNICNWPYCMKSIGFSLLTAKQPLNFSTSHVLFALYDASVNNMLKLIKCCHRHLSNIPNVIINKFPKTMECNKRYPHIYSMLQNFRQIAYKFINRKVPFDLLTKRQLNFA